MRANRGRERERERERAYLIPLPLLAGLLLLHHDDAGRSKSGARRDVDPVQPAVHRAVVAR